MAEWDCGSLLMPFTYGTSSGNFRLQWHTVLEPSLEPWGCVDLPVDGGRVITDFKTELPSSLGSHAGHAAVLWLGDWITPFLCSRVLYHR